jgi:hypothetical protein
MSLLVMVYWAKGELARPVKAKDTRRWVIMTMLAK